MKTTEKKYWVNGRQVRGEDFNSFAASISNIGLLICFSFSKKYFSVNLFKLV